MNIIREKQLLVAIAKVWSDQSTRVINLLQKQEKMRFNIAVNSMDSFIKELETKMKPEDSNDMQELTDAINDFFEDVRKQFNEHLENKPNK